METLSLWHFQGVIFVCLYLDFYYKSEHLSIPLIPISIAGTLVKLLKDPVPRDEVESADLCLYDDTLVVPRRNNPVLIYKLQGTYWQKNEDTRPIYFLSILLPLTNTHHACVLLVQSL